MTYNAIEATTIADSFEAQKAIQAQLDFLTKPATLTDKPGAGPFKRAFIEHEYAISCCIENELGEYKTVLHTTFAPSSKTVEAAYFSKGEPFNFDNWSEISLPGCLELRLPSDPGAGSSGASEPDSLLLGQKISCCEAIFAMKAMLTYSGVLRTLSSNDQQLIGEVSRRIWEEGKHRHTDPAVVGDAGYLQAVGEREVARMQEVLEEGNAEKMKKAGREFSGVFTFAGREGQADMRLDGLPWHRVACALLYHLKLRVWLRRPAARLLLTHLFGGARVREVSAADALYGVVLSRAPKVPGTSPVDPLASGCPVATAAAAAAIDDDWGNLDESSGNLLGKVCQAAVASLAAGAIVSDFGAPASTLRQLGFGPMLLTADEEEQLAAGTGTECPEWAEGGGGRAWLAGLLRGLGVKEIGLMDLAIVRHQNAAAAAAAAAL